MINHLPFFVRYRYVVPISGGQDPLPIRDCLAGNRRKAIGRARQHPGTDCHFAGRPKAFPWGTPQGGFSCPMGNSPSGGRPEGGRMRESAKRKLLKTCIVASRHPHPSSISSKLNPPSPRGRPWALPRHCTTNDNLTKGVVGLTTLWYYNYYPGGVPNWLRALPAKWQFDKL